VVAYPPSLNDFFNIMFFFFRSCFANGLVVCGFHCILFYIFFLVVGGVRFENLPLSSLSLDIKKHNLKSLLCYVFFFYEYICFFILFYEYICFFISPNMPPRQRRQNVELQIYPSKLECIYCQPGVCKT
jgi:hypothetical protein